MSDIIIAAYHGGLGDNLQFSTLPELYTAQGHDVYLWSKSYFRNNDIKELVWGHNPFIKGERDGLWNAGDCPGTVLKNVAGNAISNWEAGHGLPITYKFPKIYYSPKIDSEFKDTVLVDLSSISVKYDQDKLKSKYNEVKEKYPGKRFVELQFGTPINQYQRGIQIAHNGYHGKYGAGEELQIVVHNIFSYYDLISSAAGFITCHSGSSALASASQFCHNPNLVTTTITTKQNYDLESSRGAFIFENIDYVCSE